MAPAPDTVVVVLALRFRCLLAALVVVGGRSPTGVVAVTRILPDAPLDALLRPVGSVHPHPDR